MTYYFIYDIFKVVTSCFLFMIQIIFGAGALNILIGFFVLLQSKRTKEIISFGAFSLITGAWGISNFLVYYYNDSLFVKSTYALGGLTAASMLSWSFLYRYFKKQSWKLYIPYLVGAIVFVLSFVDSLVIGDIRSITASGIDADPGMLTDVYSLFILVSLLWSLINVFKAYRNSIGIERQQSRLVLIGLSCFVGVTITVSAILPMLGMLEYTNLDSPSSFLFVLFVAFAIVKYRFLQTKIILAQLLVGALAIMSIIQLLNSATRFDFVITAGSLVVVLVLGIFLIKSVTNDIRQKEELQRVNLQLKRNRQRLTQLNEHLMQLDQAKTDFINIASHQLRTPLGGMRWSIEMLLGDEVGAVSDEAKETIRQVYENNQRMVVLVNDLLNVARIEQGKVVEKPEMTDIAVVLNEAVKAMRVEARHKEADLRLEILSENIPSIMVAPKRFFEVIQNLISNAIKYNRPNGSVTVTLQTSKKHMRISVTDTGIGIPASEQGKIFSKFFRAGNAIASTVEGTGLGLFVVKSFIEENGGIVRFKSTEGVGTTFIIELPLQTEA